MQKNNSSIYEVFDLVGHISIGYIKELSYELAREEAHRRYKRPVDLVYHDEFTEELRSFK